MPRLTVGSLFSGIGGFDLGFERAGFEIRWQVEIDPFCRKVLEKHWPAVKRYEDVRTVYWGNVELVDVIVGGFPCQPVSLVGQRKAQEDSRWLWPHFRTAVCILRPRYIVVENVPGLRSSGFDEVLGDLAALGLDAEWESVPASAAGAEHIRDRVWIVAYPSRVQLQHQSPSRFVGARYSRAWPIPEQAPILADSAWEQAWSAQSRKRAEEMFARGQVSSEQIRGRGCYLGGFDRIPEPAVGRMAHGIPNRLDRLAGLGNSIYPRISEWIARRILEAEERLTHV